MVNNNSLLKNEIKPILNDAREKQALFKADLNLTIEDVRKLALLKFGSITNFSRKLGITKGLGSRFLSGDYIPLKASSIQKIADVLEIDAVVLCQIYDELKFEEVSNGK